MKLQIRTKKLPHLFERLIVSITKWHDRTNPNTDGSQCVRDAWNKFDIDRGPLLSHQSPTMDKSSAIETWNDEYASISCVLGPKN